MAFRQKISLSVDELETKMRPLVETATRGKGPERQEAIEELANLISGRLGQWHEDYTDETREEARKLLVSSFKEALTSISYENHRVEGSSLVHLAAEEGGVGFLIYKLYPELLPFRGVGDHNPTVIESIITFSAGSNSGSMVAQDIVQNRPRFLYQKLPVFANVDDSAYEGTIADIIVSQIDATVHKVGWISPITKILEEHGSAITQRGLSEMLEAMDLRIGALKTKEVDDLFERARISALQRLGRQE